MEEMIAKPDALSLATRNLQHYFETHDVNIIAEDAIFRQMSTGEVYQGRPEISGMLHYMYQVAFNAKAEITNTIITEDKALVEGFFKGRHIGEFAGIAPTNKEVDVPICVTYRVKDGMIKEAHIFFQTDVLFQQLSAKPGNAKQKTTFIVRDIFQLKFGHFRQVKALMNDAMENKLFPEGKHLRTMSDFTGDSYRLILEEGFDTLGEYETSLTSGMATPAFQQWYQQFVTHVERSHREILKELH